VSDFEDPTPPAEEHDGLPPADTQATNRPEARERPDDPAGTKPRHDPDALEPQQRPALKGRLDSAAVEGTAYEIGEQYTTVSSAAAVEDDAGDMLPQKSRAGALGGYDAKETKHTPRFQFMLGALFALGIAAVAALVALAVRGEPARPPEIAWSAWKPTGENVPAEIAEHIGQRYHQDNGKQLVLVKGGPLEVSDTPLKIVLTRDGNFYPVDGKAVLYQLCGVGGKDCRIPSGKPSKQRYLLLARESLELALYTFRYTDAENVVAIFPPTANSKTGKIKKQQDRAVFFQRQDVEEQLQRPLDTTLTATPPRISTITQSPDIGSVATLTGARNFDFKFQSGGTDGAYMVLEQLG
jgi:hypothetical protein